MKKIGTFLLLIFLGLSLTAHALPQTNTDVKTDNAGKKKKTREPRTVNSEAGLNIPDWGIAVDAFFDSRLTDLVPGYHIVNIVVTNRRTEPLVFSPSGDKWVIVDNSGHKYTARNHVRQISEDLWKRLPAPLRERLQYPSMVKPGKIATIDVFIPKSADLENFREVVWKSDSLGKEFNILTNVESSINMNDEPEADAPLHPVPQQPYTDEDYLKSRDEILNPTASQNDGDRWDKDAQERERKKEEDSLNFDPSFDDAIIIK